MGNLKPRETLYLYLFMVAFSFALFALGVWVGKTYYVDAHAQDNPPLQAPSDDESAGGEGEPDLDFYEDLVGDKESGDSQSASGAGDAPSSQDRDSAPPPAQEEGGAADSGQSAPAGSGDGDSQLLTTGFTVQIGAVATQGDADQLLRDLSAKGYQGFIVSPDFSQDSLYRVWVGRFAERPQAQEMEGRLKSDGFATYVKAARFPDAE